MAILSCTEEWDIQGGGANLNEVDYPRRFRIVFDDADQPCKRRMMAVDYNGLITGTTEKKPLMWWPHPYNPWLVVVSIVPTILGPFNFDVDVTYSNRPQYSTIESAGIYVNPCDQPWDVEWGHEEFIDRIDYDRDGNPILNSVGDIPDPPIQDEFQLDSVIITRNLAGWNRAVMGPYNGKANSDTFWGCEPNTVLCRMNHARRMRQGNFFFWQAATTLVFNPFFTVTGKTFGGWSRRMKNEGYNVRIFNVANGHWTLERAKVNQADDGTKGGDPTPLPVLFDPNGARLPIPEPGTYPPAYWLNFNLKRQLPFSVLGLGESPPS